MNIENNDNFQSNNLTKDCIFGETGMNSLITSKLTSFCAKHGFDTSIIEESWIEFERTSGNFTLQGNLTSWLLVCVFVKCKNATYTQPSSRLDLLPILNVARIPVSEFLTKVNKWGCMSRCDLPIKQYGRKLIFSHITSSRLFFQYCEKYCLIFLWPKFFSAVDTTYNKRKQRKKQCCENELFHFIWILFITAKLYFPEFSTDAVSLLHVLSCCFQSVFSVAARNSTYREKLLNKNFSGLAKINDYNEIRPDEVPQLSEIIYFHESEGFHQSYRDIRDKHWPRFLSDLYDRGILRSENQEPCDFLDPDTFSYNLNKLDSHYNDALVDVDLLDERQFLYCLYDCDFNPFLSIQLKVVINSCHTFTQNNNYNSPVSSPTKSPSVLHRQELVRTLVKIYLNFPNFCDEFKKLKLNVAEPDILSNMIDNFCERIKCEHYNETFNFNSGIISGIYYKLLISIVKREKLRNSSCNLSALLQDRVFYSSVIAAAFEIFIFLFKEEAFKFPWIINYLKIDSFQFFRIIEIIVRSESNFTREIVKNFSQLEELIINHYAWLSGSSLYQEIGKNNNVIPALNDVHFPYTLDSEDADNIQFSIPTKQEPSTPCTPISAINLFNDSVRKNKLASATRNLFSTQNLNHNQPQAVKPTFSSIFSQIKILNDPDDYETAVDNGTHQTKPNLNFTIVGDGNLTSDQSNDSFVHSRKQLTPLVFFMRKLYHLASSRLLSLCEFLKINFNSRSHCWTCLEHIIVEHHCFFDNHYLDQLIMCCVYAVARSTSCNTSFNEILRWYRSQDDCNQKVYRKVLLSPITIPEEDQEIEVDLQPEYSDLITYYNKVFLNPLNKYLYHMFCPKNGKESVQLAPLPRFKSVDCFNSQRVSSEASVYVSPKKPVSTLASLPFTTVYKFPEPALTDNQLTTTTQPQTHAGTKRKLSPVDDYKIGTLLYCHSPLKMHKSL